MLKSTRQRTSGVRGGCSMARNSYVGVMSALICLSVLAGCGGTGEADESHARQTQFLTGGEIRQTLSRLPYRFRYRSVDVPDGAVSAVAGTAYGRHGTVLNFGIAFGGSAEAVSVPKAGIDSSFGYRGLFVFTDDFMYRNAKGKLITAPQLKTGAQVSEASRISVGITDRLCKSATGEPCPV